MKAECQKKKTCNHFLQLLELWNSKLQELQQGTPGTPGNSRNSWNSWNSRNSIYAIFGKHFISGVQSAAWVNNGREPRGPVPWPSGAGLGTQCHRIIASLRKVPTRTPVPTPDDQCVYKWLSICPNLCTK